jgi:hypothetical protein
LTPCAILTATLPGDGNNGLSISAVSGCGSAGRAAIPERWDKAELENVVKVDIKPINGIQVLVFRLAGGPYVRRATDLALGWTPTAYCAAELLLTEQLEFVNVQPSSIIGMKTEIPALDESSG